MVSGVETDEPLPPVVESPENEPGHVQGAIASLKLHDLPVGAQYGRGKNVARDVSSVRSGYTPLVSDSAASTDGLPLQPLDGERRQFLSQ